MLTIAKYHSNNGTPDAKLLLRSEKVWLRVFVSIVGIDILPTCIHSKFYGRDQGMPSHVLSKRDFLSSQHCILTTLHTHITCDYIHKLLVTIIKKHDNKFSCKFHFI